MQLGFQRFRHRIRRAAQTWSPSFGDRGAQAPAGPRCDRVPAASVFSNGSLTQELFVLQSASCETSTVGAAAGTIHVGHALHSTLAGPQRPLLAHTAPLGAGIRRRGEEAAEERATPVAAIDDRPSESASSSPALWPDICTRLVNGSAAQFEVAGKSLLAASRKGLRALAITGQVRGEGRSTVAMCLSRAAARLGGRVALVEGDFLDPDLAAQLKLLDPHDWLSSDRAPTADTVGIPGEMVDLFLRDPRRLIERPRSADRLAALIRTLVRNYDLVAVDLPPLDCCDQLPVDCTDFDAAILVRNCRATNLDDVHTAADRLHAAGLSAVGVVENFQTD